MEVVKVENITYSYKHNTGNVLDGVGFTVEPGQCAAILGNNGAGKSTLLKCIERICPVKDGIVYVGDKNIFEMNGRTRAQYIAYVPQSTQAMNMTVFDAVLLGRKPYIKWDATEEDREIVRDILGQLGLTGYALRSVSELSGGEVQKVMLARALAQQPKFLLLDEPTSNLDPYNQHEVLRIVKRTAKEQNICVAIIIHDLNLAVRYCDTFLLLKDSQAYSFGGIETVTPEAIKEVYGINVEILEYKSVKIVIPV